MKVNIFRQPTTDKQTLGDLQVLNEKAEVVFSCLTLELPDKNNQRKVSCIPKATYKCVKVAGSGNIPYEHISITGVPKRDGICVHKGNYYTQILGCVLVGDSYADINHDGVTDILNSGKTFDKLMAILPNEFTLIIE